MSTMLEWSSIRGHQRVKQVLERAVSINRVHHALLFAGPDGVGKASLALALAASINCHARAEDEFRQACGRCPSCRKIWQSIHPDIMIVEPQGNIIKTIKIAQIREIQKSSMTAPYEARERVILIRDAHKMGAEAANALLKTLEEPTSRMRMILTTDQAHLLLDTIRSRCQLIRFGALERADVRELLAQCVRADKSLAATPASMDVASGFGEGSVGRALEILASGLLEGRAEIIDKLKSLRPRHPADYLSWTEELARDKKKKGSLNEVLDIIKVFLRDVMRYRVSANHERTINTDMVREIERWARAMTLEEIIAAIETLNNAQELLARNVNAQLVMERALRSLQPNEHQSSSLHMR